MLKITIYKITRIVIAILFIMGYLLIFMGCENKALNPGNIENLQPSPNPSSDDIMKSSLGF